MVMNVKQYVDTSNRIHYYFSYSSKHVLAYPTKLRISRTLKINPFFISCYHITIVIHNNKEFFQIPDLLNKTKKSQCNEVPQRNTILYYFKHCSHVTQLVIHCSCMIQIYLSFVPFFRKRNARDCTN